MVEGIARLYLDSARVPVELSGRRNKLALAGSWCRASMEGFVAAKVPVKGLRRAGTKASRESLITGLESIGKQSSGGFALSFSATDPVASSFVELSMLTGDGRVKT